MSRIQKGGHFKKVLYSKITVGILVAAVVAFGSVVWDMYENYNETRGEVLAAQAQLEEVRQQKTQLKQKVGRLETQEGAQARLREKFLIGKEDEQVFVVVDEERSVNEATSSSVESESWWSKFWPF